MATAKDIFEGVSRPLLDSPVSDVHISTISSSFMTDWRELSPFFDISEAEEHDIVEKYPNDPKLQRCEALRTWREHNGDKATYRRLICILCSKGKVRTAQFVADLLSKKSKRALESDILISEYSEELYDFYSDETQHPSVLQWPFSASHSYAELDLHSAPVMLTFNSEQNQSAKPVSLKSMFSSDKKGVRKVILLEGVAGSGKSTLCWYVSKEWSLGRLLQHMKLIILVSVSDPSFHSAKELADLIPHSVKDRRQAVADAVANIQGEGVCFLFDGCDEAPQLFTRGNFLYHFIAGTSRRSTLSKVTILLTSRPGPAISFELLNCVKEKVVVKGFKSLDEFIQMTVGEDRLKQGQIFKALEMKPELYSLCHLPLHAMILVFLFDFFKDHLPTTRTELFQPLVCHFLIRHMQTRTKHNISTIVIDDLSTDLPSDIHLLLCKVSKLAYQSILDKKVAFSLDMLRDAGIDPTCVSSDTFGLLQVQHQITMRGPRSLYEFHHLSLQEFLAAFHITQLEDDIQYARFKEIFKQNPLSAVLSFYAGLTSLDSSSVSNLLLEVLRKPFNLTTIISQLKATSDPARESRDIRRQLLGLMNCVYESKNAAIIGRVPISPVQTNDKVLHSSEYGVHNRPSVIKMELPVMLLQPTECLAIGYFVRYTSRVVELGTEVVLNLSSCLLGTKDIKALCYELCKPVLVPNLFLNLDRIKLTNEGLKVVCDSLALRPPMMGIGLSGDHVDDLQLAFKYFIESLASNRNVVQLAITDIGYHLDWSPVPPLTHHLVLLLYFCPHLQILNLGGCQGLFRHPDAMPLFCEALKYATSLNRLLLDGCGIDNLMLKLIANVLTDRSSCFIRLLDIGWNRYTPEGLTQFLETLIKNARYTALMVLSTAFVEEEHRSLVREFNQVRKSISPTAINLHIDCKHSIWREEHAGMNYLWRNPQLLQNFQNIPLNDMIRLSSHRYNLQQHK